MSVGSLKVVERLHEGKLLLRLSHHYLQAATNLFLPQDCEYQEQMDCQPEESKLAVSVFVRSKVKSELVAVLPQNRRHPRISKATDISRSLEDLHTTETEPEELSPRESSPIGKDSDDDAISRESTVGICALTADSLGVEELATIYTVAPKARISQMRLEVGFQQAPVS